MDVNAVSSAVTAARNDIHSAIFGMRRHDVKYVNSTDETLVRQTQVIAWMMVHMRSGKWHTLSGDEWVLFATWFGFSQASARHWITAIRADMS